MTLSQKVALILGPSLAIVFLLAGYWVKTQPLDAGAPLELHGNAPKVDGALAPPSSSAVMDVPAPPPIEPPRPDQKEVSSTDALAPATIAAPAPPAAAPPVAAPPAIAPPKFDVVRVEPTGDAVIAGHTEPGSQVAVVANGKIIVEGKSDAAGQFVLLPPPLKPGEHALALQVTPPSGPAVMSEQNVAVSVPVKGKGDVMVALAEPGKPTVLLADPTAKSESPRADAAAPAKPQEDPQFAASPATPGVAIKTVEIVEHGGFFATGLAAPNAHLRLYLNGSVLVDVRAGADGQWTVKIIKGLVPGHYSVRIDQIDPMGTVLARAEVPFDYAAPKQAEAAAAVPAQQPSPSVLKAPDQPGQGSSTQIHDTAPPPSANIAAADSAPPAASLSNPAGNSKPANFAKAPESATVVVNEIQTATVEKGSNLWRISRGVLGRGIRYTEIYAANSSQIRDPKLIYPGQVFVIPGQTN
jgi:nucleoid-associated protein YgaU